MSTDSYLIPAERIERRILLVRGQKVLLDFQLAELYEAKGDRAKAASHYASFIEYWKNADPDLQPKVAEARARLQALSRVEAGLPK